MAWCERYPLLRLLSSGQCLRLMGAETTFTPVQELIRQIWINVRIVVISVVKENIPMLLISARTNVTLCAEG